METQDEYVEFVLKSINDYKKFSDKLLGDTYEVHPQDLQYILANYQSVKFGCLAELQRRMRNNKTIKRKYAQWWNEKVSSARGELLSTMPSGKFPALKEYSIKAQEDNAKEYDDWQEKIQDAEDKYDFLKMLKTDWDSFQFILSTLNSNMTSELRSLSVDRDYQSKPKTRTKRED